MYTNHFLYSSKKNAKHILSFISEGIVDQISVALCYIILVLWTCFRYISFSSLYHFSSLNLLQVKQIVDCYCIRAAVATC